MAACNGKKRNGQPCRAKAGPSGKCAMHAGKNRARDLARKSVEARQKAKEAAAKRLQVEAPRTPEQLIAGMARVFAEVANGDLDQNLGRSLATVANSILKGFEIVDVKKQLGEIEKLLRERT